MEKFISNLQNDMTKLIDEYTSNNDPKVLEKINLMMNIIANYKSIEMSRVSKDVAKSMIENAKKIDTEVLMHKLRDLNYNG